MFRCIRCDGEFRDGVMCTVCQNYYDFPCAGITEAGYRKLGDRKNNWKCLTCKNPSAVSPLETPSFKTTSTKSPLPADLENVMSELKLLTTQTASIPKLVESVRIIQAELENLKAIKLEISEFKESIDYMQHSMDTLSNKVTDMDKELQNLLKTKEEVLNIQQRVEKLENHIREGEQRSRLNNIEIKGVPVTQSENLFHIVAKIGQHIKCSIPKEQINYIARVPMRYL